MIYLKSSSLLKAIFVVLMVGIFCSMLVLLGSYFSIIQNKLSSKEEVIVHQKNVLNYYLQHLNEIPEGKITDDKFNSIEINSTVRKKQWGLFHVLSIASVANNSTDTLETSVMCGSKSIDSVALYLVNNGKILMLGGYTKIVGNVHVPYGTVNKSVAHKYKSNSVLDGELVESEKVLSPIVMPNSFFSGKKLNLASLLNKKDSLLVNSFQNETLEIIISNGDQLQNISLKGNIVVRCFDTIRINKTTTLEDVFLEAPGVVFEEGFKGNVFMINCGRVELHNSTLKFPSGIYLEQRMDSTIVSLKGKSIIEGGIVVTGDLYTGQTKRKIFIDDSSVVIGGIYCKGYLDLRGKVFGSVYTNHLVNNAFSADNREMLNNVVIDTKQIPEAFVAFPFYTNSNSYHVFVKKVY